MLTTTQVVPDHTPLDAALDALSQHKQPWATLLIRQKMALLRQARANLGQQAQAWVDASVRGKQIDPDSPWVGEEWVTGPWALAAAMSGYLNTLGALAAGRLPQLPAITTRVNGQVVLRVFPKNAWEWLVFNGIRAEVWMQPGVTRANLSRHIAPFYQQHNPQGRVALVLGAGNISSIPALDMLYKLYGEGEVVMLKLNPLNGYLEPILTAVFAPFIAAGYLRIVTGGADLGAYLTQHHASDSVHITGSARTHDAIVYGTGPEGAARKARDEPLLHKPISSELGGVGATIVLPGPWSEADIRYQAEHIATMKLHNAGSNCVASQVLVLPQAWPQSNQLLAAVRQQFRTLPPRVAYYPGAAERHQQALAAYPQAERYGTGHVQRLLVTNLRPDAIDEYCFREEAFGPLLAQTSLPGTSAQLFLHNAVEFANQQLAGTLGVTLLVHPHTIKQLGGALEQAIADLRYGSIGINVWNAGAFLLQEAPWSAYPGHRRDDVQSGIGVTHNAFLLDQTQKTVVRGSFYNFPRGLWHGDWSLLPRPPWFVTNKTAHITARRIAYSAIEPGWKHLPGILAAALRG